MLAGVRGDEEDCLFPECEGLPDDVSPEVAEEYDFMSGDAHTVMNITLEEIYRKRSELEAVNTGFMESIDRFASLYPTHKMDQLRIVFWFDN